MTGYPLTIETTKKQNGAWWCIAPAVAASILCMVAITSSRAAGSDGSVVIAQSTNGQSNKKEEGPGLKLKEQPQPNIDDEEVRLGEEEEGPVKATYQPLELSPLAISLAREIGIESSLKRLNLLKYRVRQLEGKPYTLKTLVVRYELTELRRQLMKTIFLISLEVDSAIALIENDRSKNMDWLQRIRTRDERRLALAQRLSAAANASFWTLQGSLNIPSAKRSKYAIPSGIMSIFAGVVPSAIDFAIVPGKTFSKLANLDKPNILAPVFQGGKGLLELLHVI